MPAGLGRRQLFAYWRVAEDMIDAALQGVGEWQHLCQQAEPALHAELHVRRADNGPLTVMEVYGLAASSDSQGLDAAWLRRLDEDGERVTGTWRTGPRHLEVFERWR